VDPLDQKVIDNVATRGWHCMLVSSSKDGEPSFAYTVGLWENLSSPELIVFGLPLDFMHRMLDRAVDNIRSGVSVAEGVRWSGLLANHECISREASPANTAEYLRFARWYFGYRRGAGLLTAFQLFWPGAVDGLFPWERGCDPEVRRLQPPLHETPH